jgi:hypothetical protein
MLPAGIVWQWFPQNSSAAGPQINRSAAGLHANRRNFLKFQRWICLAVRAGSGKLGQALGRGWGAGRGGVGCCGPPLPPSFGKEFSVVKPSPAPNRRRLPCRLEIESLEARNLLSWAPLANAAPNGIGTMMLLSDGTVMAQAGGVTSTWYQLTPNAKGSYIQGTWSQLPSMNTPRLYFASNVLPSGKVIVQGGEYTDQGSVWTNTGEIYDPVAKAWTPIATFPQSNFGDDPSEMLPDGRVLMGYLSGADTYIYDPASDSWSLAATKLRGDRSDEESWVKLPDDSILSYDIFASIGSGVSTAQRYVPSLNQWVDAGTLPVMLSSSSVGYEMGPATLLPDGRVFMVGANGNTALYTPSTSTWVAGPILPNAWGADDAPGALLPDGHYLFAVDTPTFQGPTHLLEFNPATNGISQVATPAALTNSLTGPAYPDRMLVLPTGQMLFTDGSNQLWVYSETGTISSSWKPVIKTVTNNGNGTYTLTGTQLNGISEGAGYGDDAEMSSNYPLVRLRNAAGLVFYARTFNWTSTGVATGSTSVSVTFTLPAGIPTGTYTLVVVANGIASAARAFKISGGPIPPHNSVRGGGPNGGDTGIGTEFGGGSP